METFKIAGETFISKFYVLWWLSICSPCLEATETKQNGILKTGDSCSIQQKSQSHNIETDEAWEDFSDNFSAVEE